MTEKFSASFNPGPLGLHFVEERGQLVVSEIEVEMMEGVPAFAAINAGLEKGVRVLSVNGTSLAGMSAAKAKAMIKAPTFKTIGFSGSIDVAMHVKAAKAHQAADIRRASVTNLHAAERQETEAAKNKKVDEAAAAGQPRGRRRRTRGAGRRAPTDGGVAP